MLALVGVSIAPGLAGAEKDPEPLAIDRKELEAPLQVLQDADGGTYVVYTPSKSGARAWYGTGTKLYEQVVTGRSRDGASWSLATWAPRVAEMRPGLIRWKKDGTYEKSCDGADDAVLTEVTGDKAKAILAKAKLFSPAMVRRPVMLARDDRGVYYFVDHLSKLHGGKGYRVFVGKKGAMKQLPLTDVASDSAGNVFSTKTGDLRLVRNAGNGGEMQTYWVKGGKKIELVSLSVEVNSPLVFKELGIYKFMGTICDNI